MNMKEVFTNKVVLSVIGMVALFSFMFGQNFEHKQIFKNYELFYIDESTRQYVIDESFDGDCITLFDTRLGKIIDTCDSDK